MDISTSDKLQTTVSCRVGKSLTLIRPVGYSAVTGSENAGFKMLYPALGEFTEVGEDYVVYLHKKSGTQIIEFVSNTLGHHVFSAIIQGIIVHDHASIPMGGPAFATYYTEAPTNSEEGS
jgi:hypothetical protein